MNQTFAHSQNSTSLTNEISRAKAWLVVSIWLFGTLLSLLVTLLIRLSSHKLRKEEFLILLIYNIFSMAYKIASTIYLSFKYFIPDQIDPCVHLVAYECAMSFLVLSLMTLFYYSVYQFSLLKITKLFRLLVNLVHRTKTLVVFQIAMLSIIVLVTSSFSVISFRIEDRACPSVATLDDRLFELLKFLLPLPISLPIAVYSAGICHLLYYSRSRRQKNNNRMLQMRRFRKDLLFMLKFASLPFIVFFSSVLQTLVYYLPKICSTCSSDSYGFFYMGLFGYLLFALQPVVFVLIHSILKQTFLSYFTPMSLKLNKLVFSFHMTNLL